jgi:uncharacterized protein YchJ
VLQQQPDQVFDSSDVHKVQVEAEDEDTMRRRYTVYRDSEKPNHQARSMNPSCQASVVALQTDAEKLPPCTLQLVAASVQLHAKHTNNATSTPTPTILRNMCITCDIIMIE